MAEENLFMMLIKLSLFLVVAGILIIAAIWLIGRSQPELTVSTGLLLPEMFSMKKIIKKRNKKGFTIDLVFTVIIAVVVIFIALTAIVIFNHDARSYIASIGSKILDSIGFF